MIKLQFDIKYNKDTCIATIETITERLGIVEGVEEIIYKSLINHVEKIVTTVKEAEVING